MIDQAGVGDKTDVKWDAEALIRAGGRRIRLRKRLLDQVHSHGEKVYASQYGYLF